ncbi:MAG: LPS export ABC transporter periplasmic protein LptC [Cardiobacteriaceae bacterium]|nr:LPS export ABC transporter periplasmic protein LptC [Cardiobacteriaceae bacterium]
MKRRSLMWLALALFITLWWWQRENGGTVLSPNEDPVRLSLTNSTLYQYDEAGKQVTVLHSPYAEHWKNGEEHLQQPEMQNRLPDGHRRLHAASAVRNAEKNLITLSGTVEGEQITAKHHYRLNTDSLHYYPNMQLAETDDPIILSSENSRTEAVGARWQMSSNLFTLKKDIRSTYAPAH